MQEEERKSMLTNGEEYVGNQEFAGLGKMRWCALCGCHRHHSGGHIKFVLGGRNWVCARHPKAVGPNVKAPKRKEKPNARKSSGNKLVADWTQLDSAWPRSDAVDPLEGDTGPQCGGGPEEGGEESPQTGT